MSSLSAPSGSGVPPLSVWLVGARPKTLPAAVVPVAVGTAAADGWPIWWRAAAALIVSLALQVATNYVNDYADGERGTDDDRTGPARLVGNGLASARQVKIAALISFAVAGVVGLSLALAVGPELLALGAVSMLAGWGYTGGPRPYGYLGLGEVFVFIFFGLVATAGSTYVQTEQLTLAAVVAAVPVGLLAVALLVINNLRDIPGDTEAGKQTLAVRLGDAATRRAFVGLYAATAIGIGATALWWPGALIAVVGLALALAPIRSVLGGARGLELIPTLGQTGRVQLVTGLLLAFGIALS